MAKQKNLASKAKKTTLSLKRLRQSLTPSHSFIKYFLLPTALTFGASEKLANKPLPNNEFPKNAFFKAAHVPQSLPKNENIRSAFKKGYAKTIGEFLDLYQNSIVYDTIVVNKDNVRSRMCLGRYLKASDVVELKYFVPDTTDADSTTTKLILNFCKKYNNTSFTRPVTAHEASHKTAHNVGKIKDLTYRRNIFNPYSFVMDISVPYRAEEPKINVFYISLRDHAVINQWNEIGGDLGYLIYEREEFIRTGNTDSFTYDTEYTRAVKSGLVNPKNSTPYLREQEYSLLVNSTIDWWLEIKKAGYAYTSKSDVESMIKAAKEQNILLARNSVPNKMQQRISDCLTFPLDGKMVDLSKYVQNVTLTPQPMVEQIIAQAEKEMPMYEYNDKPQPSVVRLYLDKMQKDALASFGSATGDINAANAAFNISTTKPALFSQKNYAFPAFWATNGKSR